MSIGVEEFSKEFFQEILTEADADGQFVENIFFEKFCAYLIDAGEMDAADRADYRGRPGSGVRIDGYGGDPESSDGTLTLIITDFNQTSEVGRLNRTEMNALFQRLTRFLQKSLNRNWRNSLEETSPAFGVADLISQRWSKVNRIRMFLITNRALSDRVDGRTAEEFDGRIVTYSVWDINRLHRFATQGRGREDIEINLKGEFDEVLPLLPAYFTSKEYAAYLTVIPGFLLASIYDRWGARLLEQNVRVFLQARGNVNKGIKNTLENNPSMFFAYNNGITATAESVTTEEIDGQVLLTGLKNLQIVNGGQTTASVHMAFRNKIDLSKVFIQMKLSIIQSDRSEDVVPKISEFANSQNRVNAADFFANHPFHIRMEGFSRRMFAPSPDGTFRETKWFYERARGQYSDAKSRLTAAQKNRFILENPRSQLFSKTDLAKYINVWQHLPHIVSLGAQKNFAHFAHEIGKTWKKSEDSFNEAFYREAIAKVIVFKSAERIVSSQPWYQGGYRANIVAYTISKVAHDISELNRSVDFSVIWNRQSISSPMEETLAQVGKQVHDALIDPPLGIRNITEWAKKQACWIRIKDIKVNFSQAFLGELITLEEKSAENRAARKEQQVLNGIEAQSAVVNAGADFWKKVLSWGKDQGMLSEKDIGVLTVASKIPTKLPSEKQASLALAILAQLETEGFNEKIHN